MFNSHYNSFDPDKLGWTQDDKDPMIIVINYNGKRVMSISLCEAMEYAGRHAIMKHVAECDRSPWLHRWTDEAMETTVEKLKKNTK